eukprot:g257.t1
MPRENNETILPYGQGSTFRIKKNPDAKQIYQNATWTTHFTLTILSNTTNLQHGPQQHVPSAFQVTLGLGTISTWVSGGPVYIDFVPREPQALTVDLNISGVRPGGEVHLDVSEIDGQQGHGSRGQGIWINPDPRYLPVVLSMGHWPQHYDLQIARDGHAPRAGPHLVQYKLVDCTNPPCNYDRYSPINDTVVKVRGGIRIMSLTNGEDTKVVVTGEEQSKVVVKLAVNLSVATGRDLTITPRFGGDGRAGKGMSFDPPVIRISNTTTTTKSEFEVHIDPTQVTAGPKIVNLTVEGPGAEYYEVEQMYDQISVHGVILNASTVPQFTVNASVNAKGVLNMKLSVASDLPLSVTPRIHGDIGDGIHFPPPAITFGGEAPTKTRPFSVVMDPHAVMAGRKPVTLDIGGPGAQYFTHGALNFDVLGKLLFNVTTKRLLHPPPNRTAGHPFPTTYMGLSIPCYAAHKDSASTRATFTPSSTDDAIAFDEVACADCNSLQRLQKYSLRVDPTKALAGSFHIRGSPRLNDTRCQPYYANANETDDSKIAIVGVLTSSKPAVIIHNSKAFPGGNNMNLIRVNFSLPPQKDVILRPQIPSVLRSPSEGFFTPQELHLWHDHFDSECQPDANEPGLVNCVVRVNLDSAVSLGVTNYKVQLDLDGESAQYYKNYDDVTTHMAVKGGIQIPSGGDLVKFLSNFDESNPSSGYFMSGSSPLWDWAFGTSRSLGGSLGAEQEKTIEIEVAVNVTALPNTLVKIVPWHSYIARQHHTAPFPESPLVDTGPKACERGTGPCLEVLTNLTFKPCDSGAECPVCTLQDPCTSSYTIRTRGLLGEVNMSYTCYAPDSGPDNNECQLYRHLTNGDDWESDTVAFSECEPYEPGCEHAQGLNTTTGVRGTFTLGNAQQSTDDGTLSWLNGGKNTKRPPQLTVGGGSTGDARGFSPGIRAFTTTPASVGSSLTPTVKVTISNPSDDGPTTPPTPAPNPSNVSRSRSSSSSIRDHPLPPLQIVDQNTDNGPDGVLSTYLTFGSFSPKMTSIIFLRAKDQKTNGAFSMAKCNRNITWPGASKPLSGCFVEVAMELEPSQDGSTELFGIQEAHSRMYVELLPSRPDNGCSYCVLGLEARSSIVLFVVGAFSLIGLTSFGLVRRRRQQQLPSKFGLGGWSDATQPFLGQQRLSNLTVNTKKSMAKVGLNERDAMEWHVDLSKLVIQEEVGQGASAQVFKGSYCGQTVAVKRLFPAKWEPELEKFFQGEVRLLIRLHHPNIVRLYGAAYNPEDARCYIITEFCSEGSIANLIQAKAGAVARERFYDVALGITHGMAYLHSKPVVHRDLKPENVLLDERLIVKLCDFGVSRMVSRDDTAMTGQIGTPAFMAPEMIEGQRDVKGTTKVDVFSFAILLWTLWTQEVPYKKLDLTPFSLLSKILGGLRPELPDDLPKELRAMIKRCWSHDPNERMTFEEIQSNLQWMGMQQQEELAQQRKEAAMAQRKAKGKKAKKGKSKGKGRGVGGEGGADDDEGCDDDDEYDMEPRHVRANSRKGTSGGLLPAGATSFFTRKTPATPATTPAKAAKGSRGGGSTPGDFYPTDGGGNGDRDGQNHGRPVLIASKEAAGATASPSHQRNSSSSSSALSSRSGGVRSDLLGTPSASDDDSDDDDSSLSLQALMNKSDQSSQSSQSNQSSRGASTKGRIGKKGGTGAGAGAGTGGGSLLDRMRTQQQQHGTPPMYTTHPDYSPRNNSSADFPGVTSMNTTYTSFSRVSQVNRHSSLGSAGSRGSFTSSGNGGSAK